MTAPNAASRKRRPVHRSFDPLRAHDPPTLARAVTAHKDGNYDTAWSLYTQLDAESVARGRGPHWHARMMAALLWYQRTSKIDFQLPEDLPPVFGDNYRTVTGMLRDVMLHVPKWADVRYNLGVVLEGLGEIDEAAKRFQQAIDIDDAYAEAWVNLGNCKLHQGKVAEAKACFETASALNPEDALAKYNLMHALALFGDWDGAYERYEYRYLVPGHLRDHGLARRMPAWDGVRYVNRLIVTDEQGAGDIIQFARFLPYLEARVGKVYCRVRHPSLIPLLKASFPNVTYFGAGDRIPDADAHVPLLSCVNRLGVTEQQVPLRGGYLQTGSTTGVVTRGIQWQHPTSNTSGTSARRVGVCWAGSPAHKRDATRSIPWDTFKPILDVSGIAFTNLTVGDRAKVEHPALQHIDFADYLETARVVAGLDLVITVDTGAAHLTGALGVPVWNLIGAACDMRWGLGRTDSSWYSSMTLVRQTHHHDWSSVIFRVTEALKYGICSDAARSALLAESA